jgi:predicted RNase H-like nuclease (RuvC/YqgF family)
MSLSTQVTDVRERVLDRFFSTTGKAIEVEITGEMITGRQALADEIEKVQMQHEARISELQKAVENAQRRVAKLKAELNAAMDDEAKASRDKCIASTDYDSQISSLRKQLARDASPEIGVFKKQMQTQLQHLTGMELKTRQDWTGNYDASGHRIYISVSNASEIADCMAAIRRAIETAESFKFIADQRTVPERLKALREGLPMPAGMEAFNLAEEVRS